MRTDDGPWYPLTDSLASPPTFQPFRDGPVSIEPLTLPRSRHALMLPLITQVTPGLRRYAYGRLRIAAAALYARVLAPVIVSRLAGADLVHMWGGDLLGAAAVRAARTAGIPVVVTPFAHRHQWADDPASARTYRTADRVISLLETDRGWYRELGVPAERIEVSGVCAPASRVGGAGHIRSRYEILGPVVLYLGVRRSYKGVDVLLRAAEEVSSVRPDTTFAFIGPGPQLPPTRGARVLDIGQVDDATRAAWLEAADVLCLPSGGEIFPLSILEAWSVQRPVLTSDLPALRELLAKSGGGMTAAREPRAFAGAILTMLQNPSAARAMGESGRRFWAAHHTPQTVAEWHERLYRSLIEQEAVACVS